VAPFLIDRYAVSNDDFARFVAATDYTTEAERFGWSYVFAGFLPAEVRRVSPRPAITPWWAVVTGVSWRHPEGPASDLRDRGDHPVVHASWQDATNYAVSNPSSHCCATRSSTPRPEHRPTSPSSQTYSWRNRCAPT
jgi:formylglycine-generating enzyme